MNYDGKRLVKNTQYLNRLEYSNNYSSYEINTYVDLFLRSNFDWSMFRIPNLAKFNQIKKDIEILEKRIPKENEWKDIFLNKICDEYERKYYYSNEEDIDNKIKELDFSFKKMCIYYITVFEGYLQEIRRKVSSPYFYSGITDVANHYVCLKDRKRIPMNTPNSIFIRIEDEDYAIKTLKPKFTESDAKRDVIAKYKDIVDNLEGKTSLSKAIEAHFDEIIVPKYLYIDNYKYIMLKALSCGVPLSLNNKRNSEDTIRIYRNQWIEKGLFKGIVNPFNNKDSCTFAKSMLQPDWMSAHVNFWNKFVVSYNKKLVVTFTNHLQEDMDIKLTEFRLRDTNLKYQDIFDLISN